MEVLLSCCMFRDKIGVFWPMSQTNISYDQTNARITFSIILLILNVRYHIFYNKLWTNSFVAPLGCVMACCQFPISLLILILRLPHAATFWDWTTICCHTVLRRLTTWSCFHIYLCPCQCWVLPAFRLQKKMVNPRERNTICGWLTARNVLTNSRQAVLGMCFQWWHKGRLLLEFFLDSKRQFFVSRLC